MQYQEALDYLYSRLPVFHRIGPKALKPGLGNTERLCAALGNPERQFSSIHVGGTNGKGSTSHLLASVYQAAGYRVGLYTSPHLNEFTERIRLNGQPILQADVAEFVSRYQTLIEEVEPSFFEVTVAMAFDYFAHQSPDVAIIEVGLGGRLDSTNVITPLASVITNIGFDHTDLLGETLPAIAGEKAGIIKPGIPVVVGETQSETEAVFREMARQRAAPISFADQRWVVEDAGIVGNRRHVQVREFAAANTLPAQLTLDLLGAYQLRNLPAVLETVRVLNSRLPVRFDALSRGIASAGQTTGLRGRFQVLRQAPMLIADTAHNPPGLAVLLRQVLALPHRTLRIVLGMVADKNTQSVLDELPSMARYYFCQTRSPRSLPADVLRRQAEAMGRNGQAYPDVNQAIHSALAESSAQDIVLVTGSNYIIADMDLRFK